MRLKIIQPLRLGDLIICLPIAKYYSEKGYDVIWPVIREYVSLQPYVDYCTFIPVDSINDSIDFEKGQFDKEINLLIGFWESPPESQTDWKSGNLAFDEWKYKKAEVPFDLKYTLEIKRNLEKEAQLIEKLGVDVNAPYSVEHRLGTKINFDFGVKDSVILDKMEGFTIFDWIGLIEKAEHAYCVDSSFANMLNQLDLCVGRRTFRPCYEGYAGLKAEIQIPKLKEDWKVL